MNVYPKKIKKMLDQSIRKIIWNREDYVFHPRRDFTRKRKLSLKTLIDFLIAMGAGSINKELLEFFKFSDSLPSASALVQQRNKLKSSALLFVLKEFTSNFKKIKKFRGFRLLAIDGSKIPIYTNPDDKETYIPVNHLEKGKNYLHLNALYDLSNKLYLDALIQGYRSMNEFKALVELVKRSTLGKKVILIADRGYESYNNIAHLEEKGWKYLIRVKGSNRNKGILSKSTLPVGVEFDERLNIIMTRRQTKKEKSKPWLYRLLIKQSTFDFLPIGSKDEYNISFRVVSVEITEGKFEYLITNLDSGFTLEDLKELYHKRWGIEISFRELKHTIGMMHFNSKKVDLIKQEIYAKMILYNFCEMITLKTVIKQDCNRKYSYQTNFTIAMTICIKFLRTIDDKHPPDVEALISKYIHPVREGRNFTRDIKIKGYKGFLYRVA